jgi:hypothetical protein
MQVKRVDSLVQTGHSAGRYRVSPASEHPASGMTVVVDMGGGAFSTIINPQSFEDGGPEWVMRYGNPNSIRHAVASLLETFDYLLSDNITMKEATDRLRLLRAVRRDLTKEARDGTE